MAVLGEEDGEVAGSDGHLQWLMDGVCGVKRTITVFAVGLCLGEFLYGETCYTFLPLQGALYVYVLTMCFVAVRVLRLCLVLGDDGLDAWVELIDTVGYVGFGVAKELESNQDVGREACVCIDVMNVVVEHFDS